MKKIFNGRLSEISGAEASLIREKTPVQRIEEIKGFLNDSDYKAIKYAEGVLSEAEYAAIREQRQEWRCEINTLEALCIS